MIQSNFSIIGKSHVASKKPIQDASASGESNGMQWIVTADGHGAPVHFRSDVGSKIATLVINSFVPEISKNFEKVLESTELQKKLNEKILEKWTNYVNNDLEESILEMDQRYAKLSESDKLQLSDLTEGNPHLAYGTTLIAAFMKDNKAYFIQCGDGRVAYISNAGKAHFPFKEDELSGSATHSLGEKDVKYFKNKVITSDKVEIIFAQSDGWDNSFSKLDLEKTLEKNYRQIILEILSNKKANAEIIKLMENMATNGSRDDVSFAYAFSNSAKDLERIIHNLSKIDELYIKLKESNKSVESSKKEFTLKQKEVDNLKQSIDNDTKQIEVLKNRISQNRLTYDNEIQKIDPLKNKFDIAKNEFDKLKDIYTELTKDIPGLSQEKITVFENEIKEFKTSFNKSKTAQGSPVKKVKKFFNNLMEPKKSNNSKPY